MRQFSTYTIEEILMRLERRVRAVEMIFDALAENEQDDQHRCNALSGYAEMSGEIADAVIGLINALPSEMCRLRPYEEQQANASALTVGSQQ